MTRTPAGTRLARLAAALAALLAAALAGCATEPVRPQRIPIGTACLQGDNPGLLRSSGGTGVRVSILEIDGVGTRGREPYCVPAGEHRVGLRAAGGDQAVQDYVDLDLAGGRLYVLRAELRGIAFVFRLMEIGERTETQVARFSLKGGYVGAATPGDVYYYPGYGRYDSGYGGYYPGRGGYYPGHGGYYPGYGAGRGYRRPPRKASPPASVASRPDRYRPSETYPMQPEPPQSLPPAQREPWPRREPAPPPIPEERYQSKPPDRSEPPPPPIPEERYGSKQPDPSEPAPPPIPEERYGAQPAAPSEPASPPIPEERYGGAPPEAPSEPAPPPIPER